MTKILFWSRFFFFCCFWSCDFVVAVVAVVVVLFADDSFSGLFSFDLSCSDVASTLNNMAGVYASQKKARKAISLYEESLRIRREAYGDDNPVSV